MLTALSSPSDLTVLPGAEGVAVSPARPEGQVRFADLLMPASALLPPPPVAPVPVPPFPPAQAGAAAAPRATLPLPAGQTAPIPKVVGPDPVQPGTAASDARATSDNPAWQPTDRILAAISRPVGRPPAVERAARADIPKEDGPEDAADPAAPAPPVLAPGIPVPPLPVGTTLAEIRSGDAAIRSGGNSSAMSGPAPAVASPLLPPAEVQGAEVRSGDSAASGPITFAPVLPALVPSAQVPSAAAQPALVAAAPVDLSGRDWPAQIIDRTLAGLTADGAQEGPREIEIEITPQHLGPLRLRVVVTEKGTEISVAAAHPDVAHLLRDAQPELQRALAEAGQATFQPTGHSGTGAFSPGAQQQQSGGRGMPLLRPTRGPAPGPVSTAYPSEPAGPGLNLIA